VATSASDCHQFARPGVFPSMPPSHPPAPPRPWWLQMTAAVAPAARAALRTASSSAWVSDANWLMATTCIPPSAQGQPSDSLLVCNS
jgi:hypothetical protein